MRNSLSLSHANSNKRTLWPALGLPLLNVKSLPSFNPKDDPNTLAVRWELWKRSSNLHLVAKGITQEEQKTALLMHIAGRFEFAGIVLPFDSQLWASERNLQANLEEYGKDVLDQRLSHSEIQ